MFRKAHLLDCCKVEPIIPWQYAILFWVQRYEKKYFHNLIYVKLSFFN